MRMVILRDCNGLEDSGPRAGVEGNLGWAGR
ncbi:hypothetical protein RTM1035_10260 [Roseovarius sp. TM1035]|nr:hypothetical protein RTM1035_10260 [Roseovarius sp. TM1035]